MERLPEWAIKMARDAMVDGYHACEQIGRKHRCHCDIGRIDGCRKAYEAIARRLVEVRGDQPAPTETATPATPAREAELIERMARAAEPAAHGPAWELAKEAQRRALAAIRKAGCEVVPRLSKAEARLKVD